MADYAPFDPNGGTAPMAPAPGTVPARVASPGVGDAIRDAVAALAAAFAPKAITDRGKTVDKAVAADSGYLGSQFK